MTEVQAYNQKATPRVKGYDFNAAVGITVQTLNSISGEARFLLGVSVQSNVPATDLQDLRMTLKINSSIILDNVSALLLNPATNPKGNAPYNVTNVLLAGNDSVEITWNNTGLAVKNNIRIHFYYLNGTPE
ncbi:MAG: hypothetical protein VKL39_21690 [Leptolyngbyaceae bacterium]|nr:hypothetical protein [Leptolyngbyaceae bacterium]